MKILSADRFSLTALARSRKAEKTNEPSPEHRSLLSEKKVTSFTPALSLSLSLSLATCTLPFELLASSAVHGLRDPREQSASAQIVIERESHIYTVGRGRAGDSREIMNERASARKSPFLCSASGQSSFRLREKRIYF